MIESQSGRCMVQVACSGWSSCFLNQPTVKPFNLAALKGIRFTFQICLAPSLTRKTDYTILVLHNFKSLANIIVHKAILPKQIQYY